MAGTSLLYDGKSPDRKKPTTLHHLKEALDRFEGEVRRMNMHAHAHACAQARRCACAHMSTHGCMQVGDEKAFRKACRAAVEQVLPAAKPDGQRPTNTHATHLHMHPRACTTDVGEAAKVEGQAYVRRQQDLA